MCMVGSVEERISSMRLNLSQHSYEFIQIHDYMSALNDYS